MDHLKAMQVFSAIAQEGSLVGASRKLSISAASVTRIIKELEDHLGTPLIIRTTRAINLTETGEAYLENSNRILEAVSAADSSARGKALEPHGVLRLTAPLLFGRYYIAPIIREYLEHHPEVRVEAVFTDHNSRLVDEGFDLAVRIGELEDSSMRATRVGAVRQVVVGAPDYFERYGYPTHPDQLSHHRLIGFEGPGFSPSIWNFDNGLDVTVKSRLKFTDMAACLRMASLGYGLATSLSYQVGMKLKADQLQSALSDFLTRERPVSLIHANQNGKSAKLRAFLDLARERLREDPILNP